MYPLGGTIAGSSNMSARKWLSFNEKNFRPPSPGWEDVCGGLTNRSSWQELFLVVVIVQLFEIVGRMYIMR
jgi:hypothetical protein